MPIGDYMGDIATLQGAGAGSKTVTPKHATNDASSYSLDMQDFLELMVVSLKNQTMDSSMDPAEMMNQMVQMSVVEAITNISQLVSDSTSLTYAASLVGKEVTIGQYDANGKVSERPGTVTGTGTYGGEQVVFVDHNDGKGPQTYYLSAIMAIGRVPDEVKVEDSAAGSTGGAGPEGTGSAEAPSVVG